MFLIAVEAFALRILNLICDEEIRFGSSPSQTALHEGSASLIFRLLCTCYDSSLHGYLRLPHAQQADVRLPEYSVVYLVIPLALRFYSHCALHGASMFQHGVCPCR